MTTIDKMTTTELEQIRAGEHWLCRLAEELEVKLVIDIPDEYSAADLALAMIETMQKDEGKHQGAKITVRCYPWEKSRIIRAAKGEKLEDWTRKALIEKAFTE